MRRLLAAANDAGDSFLERPFTPNAIALKVRAVLDGRRDNSLQTA